MRELTRSEAVIALSDMLTEIYHFAGLEETESDFLLPSRSRNRVRALKMAIDALIENGG